MYISLISPLNINECISRLENAKKNEASDFSREFTPPKCDVRGNTFTLRKNYFHFVPHMKGELSELSGETIITYTMELDSAARQVNSLWMAVAIPIFSCLFIVLLLDGIRASISLNLLLVFIGAFAILLFAYLLRQYGLHQSEIHKKEMLEFLQKLLDAKPRMS